MKRHVCGGGKRERERGGGGREREGGREGVKEVRTGERDDQAGMGSRQLLTHAQY